MSEAVRSRRLLKARAKGTVRQWMAPCLAASSALLAFTLLGSLLHARAGGLIFPGLLDTANFGVNTGLWSATPQWLAEIGLEDYAAQGGVLAALRVEAARLILVYVLPWVQLRPFLLTSAVVLLVSAPVRYGALGQLWQVAAGTPAPPKSLFSWYLDLRLTAKALCLQLALGVWELLVQLLCLAPAALLMVRGAEAGQGSPLWSLSLAALVGGTLAGYCAGLLLAPARLLLARTPALGVWTALRQGWSALRGRRMAFFKLQLSFLPWQLLSVFTYRVTDLMLFPYQQLASIYFLQGSE